MLSHFNHYIIHYHFIDKETLAQRGHTAGKKQSQVEHTGVRQRSCDYMPQIYATVVLGPQRNKDRHKKSPRTKNNMHTKSHPTAIENSPSLVSNNQVKAWILLNGPVQLIQ